ncbi:MAG: FAD-dependent oxidoreductase [Alphaproteobacteria bacterium]|jgi:sulfide:quinone oxidoreductase|nr:FAD-dependent oxidoreductase [Alphaproteobacteria bacterium]
MEVGLDRRRLLQAVAASGLVATTPTGSAATPAPVRSRAKIVVAGAGAAGLATASRLARRLDGAEIVLVDAKREHWYQPGFTLVAAGLKPERYVVSGTADYVPRDVTRVEEMVAAFDPEKRAVETSSGRRIGYDYLVVATGLVLDYGAIDGMDTDRIGENGLGSHYAGPDAAARTWAAMSRFADAGGEAVFGRPATEMKCAGAPLKYTFLTDDILRRRGNRSRSKLTYAAHSGALFSVPVVAEKVRMLFADRGVETRHHHVMTGIDIDRRIARYAAPTGETELGYDFINVIPPMRAPEPVRQSPLPWKDGSAWARDGWVEVDKHTMRHNRYPDVFTVGDVAGVPKGKTAASVKWQVPVAVDRLVADLAGEPCDSIYDGYTSCPLITKIGRAMLIEFNYDDNLTPSFPRVIAPLEELWISWVIKETALKLTYLAMLRGQA